MVQRRNRVCGNASITLPGMECVFLGGAETAIERKSDLKRISNAYRTEGVWITSRQRADG
jgi:hypothetical protein